MKNETIVCFESSAPLSSKLSSVGTPCLQQLITVNIYLSLNCFTGIVRFAFSLSSKGWGSKISQEAPILTPEKNDTSERIVCEEVIEPEPQKSTQIINRFGITVQLRNKRTSHTRITCVIVIVFVASRQGLKKKNDISWSLWQNSLIQTVKCSPFIGNIFLETCCDAPITFINFSARKSFGSARAGVSPL